MPSWNPWHGCHPISPGCAHCYVYRIDGKTGRDSSRVRLNATYDLPVRCDRRGNYLVPAGSMLYTCFSSDFFLQEADAWRPAAYEMMRRRPDVGFFIVTKRIHRMADTLPGDWGTGYPNVSICCTVEDQARADQRLPIFLSLPIAHRSIICEPLLEQIDLTPYLDAARIEQVDVGGESGEGARVCNYDWVLALRAQCIAAGVSFHYHQTGARLQKDGQIYRIPRSQQGPQARRAGIDVPMAKNTP